MKIVRGVSSFPAAKAAQVGEDQHFSYDVQKLVSRKCSGIKDHLDVALQRTCYYLGIFMEGHFFFPSSAWLFFSAFFVFFFLLTVGAEVWALPVHGKV